MKLTNMIKGFGDLIKKNDTTILTGIVIGSTLAAVYFTAKNGPKCARVLEEMNARGATNAEKAKAIAPVIAPTVIATGVSVTAALVNHKVNTEKITSLMSAYSIVKSVQGEYQECVKKEVGEDREKEIRSEAYSNAVNEKIEIVNEVQETKHGSVLFLEPNTGAIFRSTKDHIMSCVGVLNEGLIRHGRGSLIADDEYEVSLNDLFEKIGLRRVGFADMWTWNAYTDGTIEPNLTNTFEYNGPNGDELGYVLDFYNKPTMQYGDLTRR